MSTDGKEEAQRPLGGGEEVPRAGADEGRGEAGGEDAGSVAPEVTCGCNSCESGYPEGCSEKGEKPGVWYVAGARTSVLYALIQYHRDPRRHEPRNIGVVAQRDGVVEARFADPGPWAESPNAYSQWVDYWRASLRGETGHGPSADPLMDLVDSCKGMLGNGRSPYHIRIGNSISGKGVDGTPLTEVADQLYGDLVGSPREAETVRYFLESIADPVGHATRRMKPGGRLNGPHLARESERLAPYQGRAREALLALTRLHPVPAPAETETPQTP